MPEFNTIFPTGETRKYDSKEGKSYYCTSKVFLYKALPTFEEIKSSVNVSAEEFNKNAQEIRAIKDKLNKLSYLSRLPNADQAYVLLLDAFLNDITNPPGMIESDSLIKEKVNFVKKTIIEKVEEIKKQEINIDEIDKNWFNSSFFNKIWEPIKRLFFSKLNVQIVFIYAVRINYSDLTYARREKSLIRDVFSNRNFFDILDHHCKKMEQVGQNFGFEISTKVITESRETYFEKLAKDFYTLNNHIRVAIKVAQINSYRRELEKKLNESRDQLKQKQLFKLEKYRLTLTHDDVFKFDITPFIQNVSSSFDMESIIYSKATISLNNLALDPIILLTPGLIVNNKNSKDLATKILYNSTISKNEISFDEFIKTHPLTNLPLSILIQPLDYIIVYVYNEEEPIEDVLKREKFRLMDVAKKAGITEIKTEKDLLNYEIFLEELGFKPVFSGFVHDIKVDKNAGVVPTVSLTCFGPLYFTSVTSRMFIPGLAQKHLYSVMELGEQLDLYTVLKNIYTVNTNSKEKVVPYSLREIILTVLNTIFMISFKKINEDNAKKFTKVIEIQLENGRVEKVPTISLPDLIPKMDEKIEDVILILKEYIKEIPVESFPVTNFLLGIVKWEHGFKVLPFLSKNNKNISFYREVKVRIERLLNELKKDSKTFLQITPEFLDPSSIESSLRGYFTFLSNSLSNYTPTLKSPHDIIQELQPVCFFELFEAPSGYITFRPLYYLKASRSLYYLKASRSLLLGDDIISFSLSRNTSKVKSRMATAFEVDVVGQILGFMNFAFADGKILAHYGFRDGGVVRNPNIKYKNVKNYAELTQRYQEFSQLYLQLKNFGQQTGELTCLGQTNLHIGELTLIPYSFVDPLSSGYEYEGYIVGENYSLVAGKSFNKTLKLKYVHLTDFEQLPNILAFFEKFKDLESK